MLENRCSTSMYAYKTQQIQLYVYQSIQGWELGLNWQTTNIIEPNSISDMTHDSNIIIFQGICIVIAVGTFIICESNVLWFIFNFRIAIIAAHCFQYLFVQNIYG